MNGRIEFIDRIRRHRPAPAQMLWLEFFYRNINKSQVLWRSIV
jgi:hypothetical protein